MRLVLFAFAHMPCSGLEYDSESSTSETHSSAPGWDWQSCAPNKGATKYVRALQLLGIDLAKAVPEKVVAEAITSLPDPVGDLIVGRFGKKPTRERLLRLGCTQISFPRKMSSVFRLNK